MLACYKVSVHHAVLHYVHHTHSVVHNETSHAHQDNNTYLSMLLLLSIAAYHCTGYYRQLSNVTFVGGRLGLRHTSNLS